MKLLGLLVMVATMALAQAKGQLIAPAAQQQATNCSQNFEGNNNTGIVTCYSVDKKLADQIGQLVGASKRDAKTLEAILSGQADILRTIENLPPSTSVISVNQTGGVTAGQVTFNGSPPPVQILISEVSTNVPKDNPQGTTYETTVRVTLNAPVPKFAFAASAPTLTKVSIYTTGTHSIGTTPNGFKFDLIDNAFGPFTVVLSSSKQEHFQIQYQCIGATCVQ